MEKFTMAVLFVSVIWSVTRGWRLKRVQQGVWSACTPNSLKRCITNSEVGVRPAPLCLVFRSAAVFLMCCRGKYKRCVFVNCRTSAAWTERCAVAVFDAVLWELHCSPYARIPALPVPHTPPQPALEAPTPWHSANGAALQCEAPCIT